MEVQSRAQENTVTNVEAVDKPFQCNLCEASFQRKEVWQIHTYFVHKIYPCNACDITFTDEIKLLIHTVLVHAMRSELEFIASGMMDGFQNGNNLFHTDVCGDKEYVRKYREGPTGGLYFVKKKTSVRVDNFINQDKQTYLILPKAKTCKRLMDEDFQEGEDVGISSNNDHLVENESEQRKPKKTARFLLNDTDNSEMNGNSLSKHPTREDLFHSAVCHNEEDWKKPPKTTGRSLKFGDSGKSDEDKIFYREICERKNDFNKRTQPKKFAPVLLADEIKLEDDRNENNPNEKTFVPLWADDDFEEENVCKIPKARKSLNFWSDDEDDDSDSDSDDDTARNVVYQCNSGCNKIFTNMVKLVLHKRTHRRKKPSPCVSCWRSYHCAEKLAAHSITHFRNTPYKCDVCNMAFTTRPYLFMHVMQQHKEESERCELCHKRFTEKYRLTMHVRIHYGEKPHECDICGAAFNWEAQLTQHLWAYHWGLKFKS